MKDTVYIIARADGVVRMTKRWPSLARDEIGVQLHVTIPDAAFKAPVLRADIAIHEQQVIQPTVSVEAQEAINEDDGE